MTLKTFNCRYLPTQNPPTQSTKSLSRCAIYLTPEPDHLCRRAIQVLFFCAAPYPNIWLRHPPSVNMLCLPPLSAMLSYLTALSCYETQRFSNGSQCDVDKTVREIPIVSSELALECSRQQVAGSITGRSVFFRQLICYQNGWLSLFLSPFSLLFEELLLMSLNQT